MLPFQRASREVLEIGYWVRGYLGCGGRLSKLVVHEKTEEEEEEQV